MIRCPSCDGLRSCYARYERRQPGRCKDCQKGRVVFREEYLSFWEERFSKAQIEEMALALFPQ